MEVAREAARLFWIGGVLESLDQVRLPPSDGHAPRINSAADSCLWLPRAHQELADTGGLWLPVPRAFHKSLDARRDFLEATPLEP